MASAHATSTKILPLPPSVPIEVHDLLLLAQQPPGGRADGHIIMMIMTGHRPRPAPLGNRRSHTALGIGRRHTVERRLQLHAVHLTKSRRGMRLCEVETSGFEQRSGSLGLRSRIWRKSVSVSATRSHGGRR
jgi:hypothetical protein